MKVSLYNANNVNFRGRYQRPSFLPYSTFTSDGIINDTCTRLTARIADAEAKLADAKAAKDDIKIYTNEKLLSGFRHMLKVAMDKGNRLQNEIITEIR